MITAQSADHACYTNGMYRALNIRNWQKLEFFKPAELSDGNLFAKNVFKLK